MRGTSSLAPRTIDLAQAGAEAELLKLVRSSCWEGEHPSVLEPASRWMGAMLARNESLVRSQDGRRKRLLVLVSGAATWTKRSGA